MSRLLRILGTSLVIAIAVIQFPQVWASSSRKWVFVLALAAVLCFLLMEIFTFLSEKKERKAQAQRDQKLIEATITEYVSRASIATNVVRPESQYDELTVTKIVDRGSGEDRRFAAQKAPILKANLLRSHLMPRSPWQSLVEGVFQAVGRTDYKVETDFLYELFLVNTTENQVTIREFVAEVQIGEEWKKLKRLDDLNDYKIRTGEDYKSSNKDLASLEKAIEGVPLQRGVGYRGWLRFEFIAGRADIQGQVYSRLKIIDALGGEHEVDTTQARDTSEGELTHNPEKVFEN